MTYILAAIILLCIGASIGLGLLVVVCLFAWWFRPSETAVPCEHVDFLA